jgi:hypothetical protein
MPSDVLCSSPNVSELEHPFNNPDLEWGHNDDFTMGVGLDNGNGCDHGELLCSNI